MNRLLFFLIGIMFTSLANMYSANILPNPHIEPGVAKVRGCIKGNFSKKEISMFLDLDVSNPLSPEIANYVIPISHDGTFNLNVPIACIRIGFIKSELYQGGIPLIPGEYSDLEITFDESGGKHVRLINSLGVTSDDMFEAGTIMMSFWMQNISGGDYKQTPDAFCKNIIEKIDEMINYINMRSGISDAVKLITKTNVELFYINNLLFDYENIITSIYNKQNNNDSIPSDFQSQKPEKSYYSFLKHFDLNNPQYLYADYYSFVMQSILKNEALGIPNIGDTSISDWLAISKDILANCIDRDSEIFYNILIANAYSMQLLDMKPLTEIQKKNIQTYYNNQPYTQILLEENKRVIELKNSTKATINSKVSSGVINDILLKNKEKVIFIDFWATWCGPCLVAMRESELVKEEFQDKDVAFVYITDISSARKTWELKASEIGGTHYYLEQEEWNYIFDYFGFSSIPSYLIYDTKGELRRKNTSFMGVEKMQEWIKELLPR